LSRVVVVKRKTPGRGTAEITRRISQEKRRSGRYGRGGLGEGLVDRRCPLRRRGTEEGSSARIPKNEIENPSHLHVGLKLRSQKKGRTSTGGRGPNAGRRKSLRRWGAMVGQEDIRRNQKGRLCTRTDVHEESSEEWGKEALLRTSLVQRTSKPRKT